MKKGTISEIAIVLMTLGLLGLIYSVGGSWLLQQFGKEAVFVGIPGTALAFALAFCHSQKSKLHKIWANAIEFTMLAAIAALDYHIFTKHPEFSLAAYVLSIGWPFALLLYRGIFRCVASDQKFFGPGSNGAEYAEFTEVLD